VRIRSIFCAIVLAQPVLINAQRPGLFASDDVLALRLEAPFDDLFARAKRDPDYAVEGTLVLGDTSEPESQVPVSITLRGHTSRRESECTFPKLKITTRGDDPLPGTGRTIKVGTHCGEAANDELTAKFGRLPNERSPWREAAVYRILRALDVPTLRSRPARITYVYRPSEDEEPASPPERLTRNALLLEDEDEAVARLGNRGDIEPDEFTTADAMFSPADAATLAFGQALIGNFDWCVKFFADDAYRCDARMKLWNVIAARTEDGKARPIMYDFDVSGMVTGSHRWFATVFNAAFVPSKSPREVEVISQVQRTRSLFPRDQLDATRRRFVDRRDQAYRALEASPIDPDGRRHIAEYLEAFFREIASAENFYRPVVVRPNTTIKTEPDPAARGVCASRGPVPTGTPVSEPLETRGPMMRVHILDALWHWGPPAKCAPVQSGSVWVEVNAVSRDYPAR
jgi:hypothetical protein